MARQTKKLTNTPCIAGVDLFAGGGGLSLGFAEEGFEIACAYEFWEPAARCYEANFSHPLVRMDLSDTERAAASVSGFSPDLMMGGPPCQDFSHAGKRVEAKQAPLTL